VFPIKCNTLPTNRIFAGESERETDKAEGFADDTTALTQADQESISTIEEILVNFENVSSLACNFAKSSITFIGNYNAGNIITKFSATDSFTLLGVKIDNNLKNLQTNFDKAKVNMQKIVNFWSRFNLSLTGRINVAKCFLLSQVNYLGCIINPDPPTLLWMQNLINNFCTGSLRIAAEKLYLPPAKGGLGLINLRETLTAQQTIWFKRALVSSRDNWRWDLWQAGCGNCLTPDPDLLGTLTNPILYNLTLSMRQFLTKFYTKENSFLDSYVLNNP
jgi:hypothetical protein